MIAAIYARKTTDQNLPDAEKSVTRQVEHATAYADAQGLDGRRGPRLRRRRDLAAPSSARSGRACTGC